MPDSVTVQPAAVQLTTYNPNEIINIFTESLVRKAVGVVNVRGIFHRGKNTSYSGYYYDFLRDEYTSYELSIKIPATLREGLDEGNLVEMRGTIDRKVSTYCSVQLVLNVTGLAVVQEQTVSEDDMRRLEIRRRKAQSGYRKVESILEGAMFADRRPSVALVFADSSITDADFDAGKEAAQVQVDFTEYRVSFAQPHLFVQTLVEVDAMGHDVVCIVRGGGSGLEALENLDVLECVAGMVTAVVSAVGHAADKVFINEISDLEIGTPSLLGSFFKDLVERVAKKKADSTAALTRKIEAQFREQIDTARKQNADLQKKFEDLTRNSAEATRKHDEQVKTAQEQNKGLQEQIAKMAAAAKVTQKQNDDLQKKLEELSKNSAEATRKHDEQVKEAQAQNRKLQETLDTVSKESALAQKTYSEQVSGLQTQLKDMTESSRKQSEDLTRKIGEMQQNVTRLTDENTKVSGQLVEVGRRNAELHAQLQAAQDRTGSKVLITVLAVAVLALIAALILK